MATSKFISDLIKDKTIFIVSDLHMGDGSPSDNFKKHRKKFETFLDMVEDTPNSIIVLNGDIFELWQSQLGDVIKEYFDIIKRLIELQSIFIVGNHDMDFMGLLDLPLDIDILKYITKDISFIRKGQKIEIKHGYEFDTFNDPQKSIVIGKILGLLVGLAEKAVGEKNHQIDVESKIRSVEPFFRRLASFFSKIYHFFYGMTAGERAAKGKSINGMYENIVEYGLEHPNDIVISGHTHIAGWIEDWYVNCGAWWMDNASYVKIDLDGYVDLRSWPENEFINKKLY